MQDPLLACGHVLADEGIRSLTGILVKLYN
jgi:hypothetical protein